MIGKIRWYGLWCLLSGLCMATFACAYIQDNTDVMFLLAFVCMVVFTQAAITIREIMGAMEAMR